MEAPIYGLLVYAYFGVYDCFMPDDAIRPTSQIVSRLYRERTMGTRKKQ